MRPAFFRVLFSALSLLIALPVVVSGGERQDSGLSGDPSTEGASQESVRREFGHHQRDLILLVDASQDSATSSKSDVNGDGKIDAGKGFHLSRHGLPFFQFRTGNDSILAAEIYAARQIVNGLRDGVTRVGVVLMAQPFDPHPCELKPDRPGAEVLQPLTFDVTEVRRALDRIEETGPGGASNLAEGIRLSVSMLAGLPETPTTPRPGARREVIFLGHRAPTFPFGSPYHTSPDDISLAERAATVAAKVNVRLEVIVFGDGKGFVVNSLARIAGLTGGRLTRVKDVRSATFDLDAP